MPVDTTRSCRKMPGSDVKRSLFFIGIFISVLSENVITINCFSTQIKIHRNSNIDLKRNFFRVKPLRLIPSDQPSDTSGIEDDDMNATNKQRRKIFQLTGSTLVASLTGGTIGWTSSGSAFAATDFVIPNPKYNMDYYWPLGKIAFSLLPLAGSKQRATVEECIIPDTMWTHDQIQGVVNVNVPVRQTVIRLSKESGGGLWVHNPVAPTRQLIKYMNRLQERYGPVRHIVLATVALEHKATLGDFARYFPEATVWVQPGQWAFPTGIPLELLGVPQRKTNGTLRKLPSSSEPQPEWTKDIEYETLGPFKFKAVGAFSETAFFHKSSDTLLTTDVVISVTEDPPAILQVDPRALLFHSRDNIADPALLEFGDTEEIRRRGWRRIVQFGLIFFPSQIEVTPVFKALDEAKNIPPEYGNLGKDAVPFALYPWSWKEDGRDRQNFLALTNNGALFCPPILTKLILNREPEATLRWADRVSTRFSSMKRIIPCHLNNNIAVTATDFNKAFDTLRTECCNSNKPNKVSSSLEADLVLLQTASEKLTDFSVVAPKVDLPCT